jgi:hypothetical protein
LGPALGEPFSCYLLVILDISLRLEHSRDCQLTEFDMALRDDVHLNGTQRVYGDSKKGYVSSVH